MKNIVALTAFAGIAYYFAIDVANKLNMHILQFVQ